MLDVPVTQTPRPPRALSDDVMAQWGLDPSIVFINHGCFGARPRSVIQSQSIRREQYEARPIEWLDRKRKALLGQAAAALGQFIGAQPSNLGFVANATSGINAVLRSLEFKPGDELLTTTHVYNAVRLAMRHLAQRAGAAYAEIDVPMPVASPDDIHDALEAAMSERTRLVVVDHVTSPTAIIFPVERIVQLCADRGVDVLIDGAHAPGMLTLDIERLDAAYYAGNLHKWVSAPSGAAFLWVRPDKQRGLHPNTISHFYDQGLHAEFEWQGTRDITPWLCVEDALSYFRGFGWDQVMRHNHQMAVWAHWVLCQRWNVEPASPVDGSMIGSMATVALPAQERFRAAWKSPDPLQAALYGRYRIEAPIIDWGGRLWTRASCQIYNRPEHYERLADAVLELSEHA